MTGKTHRQGAYGIRPPGIKTVGNVGATGRSPETLGPGLPFFYLLQELKVARAGLVRLPLAICPWPIAIYWLKRRFNHVYTFPGIDFQGAEHAGQAAKYPPGFGNAALAQQGDSFVEKGFIKIGRVHGIDDGVKIC